MIYAYVIWNMIVFLMYGTDKYRAKRNLWRIKEKTLLLSALFFGGAGAFLGMTVFRHKTKHWYFKVLVPLCFVLNMVMVFIGLY